MEDKEDKACRKQQDYSWKSDCLRILEQLWSVAVSGWRKGDCWSYTGGIDNYDCRIKARRKRNDDQCDYELYKVM